MGNELDDKSSATELQDRPYAEKGLYELATLISGNEDAAAVKELLVHRVVGRDGRDRDVGIIGYLCSLRRRHTGRDVDEDAELWDRAYDVTLEKFSHLPAPGSERKATVVSNPHGSTSEGDGTTGGPPPTEVQTDADCDNSRVNCALYYAAFLRHLQEDPRFAAAKDPLEADAAAASALRVFIRRHFYLSYLEARRHANPFISRFAWRIPNRGSITVWMPKYLNGRERRRWLETHVDSPDPKAPGERARVQAIIDARLAIPRWTTLGEHRTANRVAAPESGHETGTVTRLVTFIAREKATSAREQRPAIRRLGPERIEDLVVAILNNLLSHDRKDKEIARQFGLSKTAFSHFAGSQWRQGRRDESGEVPDLWRNMAELLSNVNELAETARRAGVFDAALRVCATTRAARLRERRHD